MSSFSVALGTVPPTPKNTLWQLWRFWRALRQWQHRPVDWVIFPVVTFPSEHRCLPLWSVPSALVWRVITAWRRQEGQRREAERKSQWGSLWFNPIDHNGRSRYFSRLGGQGQGYSWWEIWELKNLRKWLLTKTCFLSYIFYSLTPVEERCFGVGGDCVSLLLCHFFFSALVPLHHLPPPPNTFTVKSQFLTVSHLEHFGSRPSSS